MSATDGSEMDGYEALVSELRANPPVAPERLRQRVLEGAPATRAPRSRKRKLVLVVVPAAVVLAVGRRARARLRQLGLEAPDVCRHARTRYGRARVRLIKRRSSSSARARPPQRRRPPTAKLAPSTKSKSSQSYYARPECSGR